MSPPLWFANFLSYCLQALLLALVGTALPALFRLRAPRVLLAYWQGLLVICLVLPALQPWRPAAVASAGANGTASITFQDASAGAADLHSSLYVLVAAALLAGMLVRLGWLAVGLRRLRAIRRAAHPFVPLPDGMRELQSRLRVSPGWYLSAAVESPATFGLRPASILLPERFPELSHDFQRAIAGHELLHVARRDWIFNLAEELILAVFWFHPAIAWAVSRIRLSREQTVDAEAVRLIDARKPYMRALLEIASGGPGPALGAAPTFLKERQLAQRIERLAKEVTMSKARLYLSLTAIIGLLILAGGVGVSAFPLRAPAQATSPQPAGKEIPPSDRATIQPVSRVQPVYPVDAKRAGIEGKVRLRVTINTDGSVTDLQVLSGPPQLVKSAVDAVQQWRYPTAENARITDVTINYTLAKGSPAAPASIATNPANLPVYRATDKGVTRPAPIYKPDPPYTKEAKAAKVEGKVRLWMVIGADGAVTDVEATQRLDKGLTESAVNTVKTWKFQPAMKDGKPVACKVMVEISFKLF